MTEYPSNMQNAPTAAQDDAWIQAQDAAAARSQAQAQAALARAALAAQAQANDAPQDAADDAAPSTRRRKAETLADMSDRARKRRGSVTTGYGSRTDVGCVRDHNEDSLAVMPPLFMVADGMGGHAAGEVASEIAVQVLTQRAPSHADAKLLGQAVQAANKAIIQAAHEGVGRAGMGTTCTAAILEGERAVIAQVGDSRAYLLHRGQLQLITRDHSLMADLIESGQITPEEARVHPKRSVITRALGSDIATEADLYEINVESGDRLLLCSDGLSGMLEDDEIAKLLASRHDPQRAADALVNAALDAGGLDNVTAVVVDVAGFAEKRTRRIARKTKLMIFAVLVAFALIVAGAFAGINLWTCQAAYLTDENGYVAVYQGVPGSVFGMNFSNLAYTTGVPTNRLQPGLADRLITDTISVDSMQDALNLVAEYERQLGLTESTVKPAAPAEDANADAGLDSAADPNALSEEGVPDYDEYADGEQYQPEADYYPEEDAL